MKKKEADKLKSQAENKDDEVKRLTVEITELKERLEQKIYSGQSGCFLVMHSASCGFRVSKCHGRKDHEMSNSDSGAVIGLETWRQMSHHFAESARTRMVSLLKQIMSPAEWNDEKSVDVIQQHYHWLEFIPKYAAISSDKIADTVNITLALQNVRGNPAQSLNVSVSESTTWPQVHNLLVNYFNTAAPTETKSIYQFNNLDKKEEINYVKKGQGKGQKSKGRQKGMGSKGPQVAFSLREEDQSGKEKPNQKGKGHGPQKDQKAKLEKERCTVRYVENQVIKLNNAGGTISNSKELKLHNHLQIQGKFTISWSILRINPFRLTTGSTSRISRFTT